MRLSIAFIAMVAVAGCWRRAADTGLPPPMIVSAGCPIAGCQYGTWTATRATDLYAEPDGLQVDVDLAAGDSVLAQSGEIHSVPRRARVVAAGESDEAQGIRTGETIYALYPLGDETMALWQSGFMKAGSAALVIEYDPPVPKDQSPLDWTWWVKVRIVDGTTAWLKNPKNLQGMEKSSR